MKENSKKIALIIVLAISFSIITVKTTEAKTVTKLPPKWYICSNLKESNVKLSRKKLVLKNFDICPARDGWFVVQGGNASFKLSQKCKIYNYYEKRINFKKAKKKLNKHPEKLYSFKLNKKNIITRIETSIDAPSKK